MCDLTPNITCITPYANVRHRTPQRVILSCKHTQSNCRGNSNTTDSTAHCTPSTQRNALPHPFHILKQCLVMIMLLIPLPALAFHTLHYVCRPCKADASLMKHPIDSSTDVSKACLPGCALLATSKQQSTNPSAQTLAQPHEATHSLPPTYKEFNTYAISRSPTLYNLLLGLRFLARHGACGSCTTTHIVDHPLRHYPPYRHTFFIDANPL